MKPLLVLMLCALAGFAGAPGEVEVVPQTANLQSTVVGRPSPVIGGADAITIPQLLSCQGRLTDTLGVPVADTLYAIRFRLYAQATGGTQFWEEDQQVRTENGLFSVLLGVVDPIDSVPSVGGLYLGVAVEGGPELVPRLRIAGAAYAYLTARAASADLLQGKDTTAFDTRYVNEGQVSSVTSNMLVDGTIAAVDLNQMGASSGQVMKWTGSAWAPRNDSVGQSSGGTVRKVLQATGVVLSPNPIIDSGTVRFDTTWGDARFVNEAQANSVSGSMIVDGTVTSADIRDTTIVAAKLKDGSVTSAKIALPYSGSVATTSPAFKVINTQAGNDSAAIPVSGTQYLIGYPSIPRMSIYSAIPDASASVVRQCKLKNANCRSQIGGA